MIEGPKSTFIPSRNFQGKEILAYFLSNEATSFHCRVRNHSLLDPR